MTRFKSVVAALSGAFALVVAFNFANANASGAITVEDVLKNFLVSAAIVLLLKISETFIAKGGHLSRRGFALVFIVLFGILLNSQSMTTFDSIKGAVGTVINWLPIVIGAALMTIILTLNRDRRDPK